ncbi:AAA family ATPase [Candidatus Woesearchaeota archaeon]|nr:AAA family ATPase [Candidatus Woesearchaeota archaeon]
MHSNQGTEQDPVHMTAGITKGTTARTTSAVALKDKVPKEFKNIIGSHAQLLKIQEVCDTLLQYDPQAQTNPILDRYANPPNIVVYGPPGGGKTMILSAAEDYIRNRRADSRVIWLDNGFRTHMYSDSTKNLEKIFSYMKDPQGTGLILGDDADTVFSRRTAMSNEEDSRVITAALHGMQPPDYRGNYACIFTTNYIEKFDHAVLSRCRPVFWKGPVTPEQFVQLLSHQLEGTKVKDYLEEQALMDQLSGTEYRMLSARDINRVATSLKLQERLGKKISRSTVEAELQNTLDSLVKAKQDAFVRDVENELYNMRVYEAARKELENSTTHPHL